MDPLDSFYRQNPAYQAAHDGAWWVLADADGWGLVCDDAVHRVWSAFDGRPTDQVIAALSAETGLSAAFVQTTAKVLARAGLLIPSAPLPPIARVPSADPLPDPLPLVSVIILASRQARVHLETCLPSVLGQTYPRLEVILVDNQTTDDSVAFTRERFPQVRILSTPKPLGFGEANNLAMAQARGDFLFLINEDTEMEPDCVAEAVRVMARSERIACVAVKMKLFYMRNFFNSMGNSTHPDGHSDDNFIGYLDVGQFDHMDQVFTACFGAAMLRRSVVEEIGGMDRAYFVYCDDIDWAFRARLRGYDVVAAPRAVIYHKFNATVGTMVSTFKLGLSTRNRLRFVWKNLDFARARHFTRLYREEDRHAIVRARQQNQAEVVRTYRRSWRQWTLSLPELLIARWRTRSSRRPSFDDDAAFALIERVPPPMMYGRYPVIHATLIRGHYMRLEALRPEAAPAPEDQVELTKYVPSIPPSLLQKAWRVLKKRGLRGLLRETASYLRWRLASR